jgi:predicted negative regulator of RcsB-dependent stress response
MTRLRLTLRSLLLAWLIAGAVPACAPSPEAEWLAAAQSAHGSVDGGDGRDALEAFLARSVPAGVQSDDARVVRQDAAYRLARLLLADGDAAGALAVASDALDEGEKEDVFTANLYVVRGQALEAQGRPVRATMDYHDALLINEALLEAALADDGDEDE